MNDVLIGIFSYVGMFLSVIIAIPWIGYVVHKYWDWCDEFQRRIRNAKR